MKWVPTEPAWQYALLDRMEAGIDRAQLERSLQRTPTERLEAVREMAVLAEEIRRSRARLEAIRELKRRGPGS